MAGVDLAAILLAGVGLVAVARLVGFGLTRGARARAGRVVGAARLVVWTVVAVAFVADPRAGLDRARALRPVRRRAHPVPAAVRGDRRRRLRSAGARRRSSAATVGSTPASAPTGARTTGSARCRRTRSSRTTTPTRSGTRSARCSRSRPTSTRASTRRIPAQYQILNIKYMILPDVPGSRRCRRRCSTHAGRHRLYEVDTTGYFQVVDVMGAVAANRTDIDSATSQLPLLGSRDAQRVPVGRVRRRSRGPADGPGNDPAAERARARSSSRATTRRTARSPRPCTPTGRPVWC